MKITQSLPERDMFIVEIEPGDNRDKIMQYLEALEWLINGEKCRAKEGYQERVCRE